MQMICNRPHKDQHDNTNKHSAASNHPKRCVPSPFIRQYKANWDAKNPNPVEIPFKPSRVVLQDFTGVPAVVDLAALRSAMQRMGGDYATFLAALADPGFETNLTLTESYKPAPYPGRAVLIQAQDSPVRYANTLWDWSQKVRNGLESRLIEGSYASILHEPDVRGLATQIAACLDDD